MESISLRRALKDDANAIARVNYAAYGKTNNLYQAFYKLDLQIAIPRATAAALELGDEKFLLATAGETGEVVGYVRYNLEDPKPKDAEDAVPGIPSAVARLYDRKPHLEDLWKKLTEQHDAMDACYEQASGGTKHYFIRHLMIDPAHQRKGVGRKLMEAILAESDAAGLSTMLLSSRESYPLYRKLGFEELGKWTIANEYFAEEIVKIEAEQGITSDPELVENTRGIREEEAYMIRKAPEKK